MARLLFVEDQAAYREALRRKLAQSGHEVDTAGSKDEAIAAFAAKSPPYQLIITDYELRDEEGARQASGVDFARDVRQKNLEIPIILHSSQPMDVIRAEEPVVAQLGLRYAQKVKTPYAVLEKLIHSELARVGVDAPSGREK